MDHLDAAGGPVSLDHSVLQELDPQRSLYHCAHRSGHLHPPVPWREDTHRARHAPDHHHSGAVRRRSMPRCQTPTPSSWSRRPSRPGLRWGELAELWPVSDLDLASRMLTVSRKVIELNRVFHPDGRRFLLKHYPKDKEYRRLKLSPQVAAQAQGARPGPRPRPGHTSLRAAGGSPGTTPCCGGARCRRVHRAHRGWPPVPARHTHRLQRRKMPLHALPPGLRGLPRCPPRRKWDSFPAAAGGRRGGAHRAQLVPPHGLAPGLRSRWLGRYARAFMISGIHMRRGCSPAEPTCRS